MATKQVTAEFYALHVQNPADESSLLDLLEKHSGNHAPSLPLEAGAKEQFQIRSILPNKDKTVFRAVFGRCRYDEALEQASEKTQDKDVKLLPGHGLVEKNHFLFIKSLNLIVYQRNGNGSRIGRLQRYLTRLLRTSLVLEAVLTEDSYSKLEHSGPMKKIELSVTPPSYSEEEQDRFLHEAIRTFKEGNAKRVKLTLVAERNMSLSEVFRAPLIDLARAGCATIARATVSNVDRVDISDDQEEKDVIIDLILNKITKKFDVEVDAKNKLNVQSIYDGLAKAKNECNQQLKAFFSPK
ncbi:DUF6731 family protein [Delftia acidovorans]|uniref:DUF6731 family protein n=1 Tax=Delftia acidovorans TaxID=80866 RepID=UPI00286EFBBE|nr:DUF6731 family protein [Delftia acidovorans]